MLVWKVIEPDNAWLGGRREWYRATLTADVNCSQYEGKTGRIPNRVYVNISFGIHPRQGRDYHSECFPYMLLVNGQTRIYLETIEQGKEIAEKIAQEILEQLNCTKNQHAPHHVSFFS